MKQHDAAQFVEENLKTIFAYALSRVSNKEDAEDLAGEIILAILQSAPKLRRDDAFFGYVWATAANTYKKYLRRKKHSLHDELQEYLIKENNFTVEIADELWKSEKLQALRRELSLLSKEYRECTVAYYYDRLSCGQVAEKLHISLEMVKYYLFKTRKILKEGISMEREFGEKSFNPAVFEFVTIFSGRFNAEYRNLFNRKLPGNILLSAYYTPMTVRELSVELGVASVYLEDELELLEKYHFLTVVHSGKYQTNLIIFTEAFTQEFQRTAENKYKESLFNVLHKLRMNLQRIRQIGFYGADMDDNHLLWPLLWMLMRSGHCGYEKSHIAALRREEIYDGATGVNYGINYDSDINNEYNNGAFAGYSKIDDDFAASFADFGILPEKNHYGLQRKETLETSLHGIFAGEKPDFIVLTTQQAAAIESLLAPETSEMQVLYQQLADCAVSIMKIHAPAGVSSQIERIVSNTIFFRTVGLLGALAVKSGALEIPDESDDAPIAFYIYHTTDEDKKNVSQGVQM